MTTAEFLLARKLGKGDSPSIVVEALNVTENGTYSESGKAYSPVNVDVPQTETEALNVTANGTYTAPSGKAYTPVNVAVDGYALKSLATPSEVASFNAAELPLNKLKVGINAVQDLHGYDHPWVGGAGKNKAESVIDNWSNKGITATRNDDGSYSITGTATESVTSNFLINVYPVSEGEQYIVTNKKNQTDTASKYTRCICSFYNDSTYKSEVNVSEGQTITVPSNVNRLRLSYVWNGGFVVPAGAIIYPMVRLATETDPTFTPYSNICPISGWDAANVSDVDDVDNPTVTQTTTISLPQTVYGGELDVVNGTSGNKLNREKIVFDGSSDENWSYSESWSKVNTSAFYLPPNSAIKFVSWDDYPFLICNILKPMSRNEIYDEDSTGIGLSGSLDGGSPTIRVPKTITNVNDLRTWLANNNIEAVYELATPTTFATQPTPIKSLNGQNNLSVDTGEVMECEWLESL